MSGYRPGPTVNPALAAAHQSRSALAWDDVRAIRAAHKAGTKLEAQAARYGVDVKTVWWIVQGHTWKDPAYVPGRPARGCERPDCPAVITNPGANRLFCSARCRSVHNRRLRTGYYLRRQEADAERRTRRRRRDMLRQPWRFDGPAGLEDGGTLGEYVVAEAGGHTTHVLEQHTGDPLAALEAAELRDVVGDLDLEDLATLTDRDLAELRARLARAGYTPNARSAAA